MSIREERRYNFHKMKSLLRADNTFSFHVQGKAKQLTTKFGTGWYLLGQRVTKGTKEKNLLGLLKVSPTTIGSIADVSDVLHLDDLNGMIIDFEFIEKARTILATKVREWGE